MDCAWRCSRHDIVRSTVSALPYVLSCSPLGPRHHHLSEANDQPHDPHRCTIAHTATAIASPPLTRHSIAACSLCAPPQSIKNRFHRVSALLSNIFRILKPITVPRVSCDCRKASSPPAILVCVVVRRISGICQDSLQSSSPTSEWPSRGQARVLRVQARYSCPAGAQTGTPAKMYI